MTETQNATKKKESTEKLYSDIIAEYKRLKQKKAKGVPMYSEMYILKTLSEKFYKSTSTITNIIYGRV